MTGDELMRIVLGSFGGAFIGIIAPHVPGTLGYGYRRPQNVELVASLVGFCLAATVCLREHVFSRQAKASKD
jgi:hypothetical protein